jgi:long-chain acyl-CoA synthetase
MQGYYKKPDKTAEVFKDIKGKRWFRTGDVGKMVEQGGIHFLKITDRKKELLKTSGGKYVAPAPIESRLKEEFLIEQMMVVGDQKKFVSALIVPSQDALKDWCVNNGVQWKDRTTAVNDPKVIAKYQDVVNQCNPEFSHIEQVKKFKLLDADWEATKEDGSDAELTPTMKLKRRVIMEKFSRDIDEMYGA